MTLNTLKCTRKDVQEGRLRLKATKVEVRSNSDYDPDFLRHMLPVLEWPSLVESARAVNVNLPERLDDARVRPRPRARARARQHGPHRRLVQDGDFMRALHHVLFDVHILEGELVCVESGQVFPIEEGRPNMMLDEDLVY